jgi:hypothetical protein
MDMVFKAVDRHGAEMEFELIPPTDLLERESEMEYRKAYSAAIKEGILPREKMRNIFKDSGIWTSEDEAKFTDLVREIGLLNIKLDNAVKEGKDDECIKIAGEMGKLRVQMLQLFTIQQSAYMQSCEGYAELVRLEALMASRIVIKANKQRYWKNYKDYVIERDNNDRSTVASQAMTLNNVFLEQQRDIIIGEYPEQKWLQQLQKEIIEKASEQAKAKLAERVREAINADKGATGDNQGDAVNQGANS